MKRVPCQRLLFLLFASLSIHLVTSSLLQIASASYEARAAGIYNGMFMGAALKLCPSLTVIPYDFQGYQEVSQCSLASVPLI